MSKLLTFKDYQNKKTGVVSDDIYKITEYDAGGLTEITMKNGNRYLSVEPVDILIDRFNKIS